jgi:hypothetical protein
VGSFRGAGRRRMVVVAMVASVVFWCVVVVRSGSPAKADETRVSTAMTCAISGPVVVTHTVDHRSDIAAGERFTVDIASIAALDPRLSDAVVDTVKLTFQVAPLALLDQWYEYAASGNVSLARIDMMGDQLTLTLQAEPGVTVRTLAPHVTFPFAPPWSPGGGTVVLAPPSQLDLALTLDGSPLLETCSADPGNPPLLSLALRPGSTTSWRPTPTGRPGCPYSNQCTTTTQATTTSTVPRPHLLAWYLKAILCRVFHLC